MAKNILLVDDNHLVVKSLHKLLEGEGYIVATAESGQAALDIISHKTFDLIITDIRMPGINGVETVEKIKQLTKDKKEIPIIFITGYTDSKAFEEAKKLKASDFIYKPFDKDQFLKSVAMIIGNK